MTLDAETDLVAGGRGQRAEVVRAGALVAAAGLVSRAVGWLRLIVIIALFGASREVDAYFVAFRIPDAVFQLVAGGVLGSVLVPLIAQRVREGAESAWRTVAGVANVLLIALAALSAAAAFGAPWLMPLIAPGFDAAQLSLAVDLTRLMLVSPICFALGAVAASVLHSHHRFSATAVAPIVYNLAIIGAAVALGARLGVTSLAVGVAVGAVGYLCVQLIALFARTSYRHRATGLGQPGARSALASLAPRSLGLAGTQLIFIVNTALASTLGAGAVTAYTIAFTLLLIPVGLVGVPLGMVLFPSLARAAADGSTAHFRRVMLGASRFTLWSAAGLTAVAVVLHRHVVELLFGHGALDAAAIGVVSATVVVLFLGIGAHSLNLVMARAFYAWNDTRTPVGLTLAQVVLTIVVGLAAVGTLGLPGLALAVAVGSWAKAIALVAILAARRGLLDGAELVRAAALFGAAGSIAALAAVFATVAADGLLGGVLGDTARHAATLVIGGGAGLAAFLAASRALALPEAGQSLDMARVALRRR